MLKVCRSIVGWIGVYLFQPKMIEEKLNYVDF